MKLDEKRLSSSAMGDNFLYLWNTTGRLRVDLYHYIKRGYPLPSYKLDDTSRNFLGESVKKVVEKVDAWELTIGSTTKQDVAKGRSVVLLNANGDTLCDKLDVLDYEPGRLVVSLPDDVIADEVAKWAVVKDDLSPKEMFKMQGQGPAERAIIARYCVQDCQLVLDLFKKLDVFNNAMSMANVCSVPISYIFLRGQGVKIESLMFKYCYESEQCIMVLPAAGIDGETYEGAIVLDPVPGFYTTPVGVADFASLYPSTIISENISHDTLVWVKDFDESGTLINHVWGSNEYDNMEGIRYTDIEYDNMIDDPNDMRKNKAKIKAGTRVCRYAQDIIGTIPKIVAGLLAARKAKRKEGEKESDPFRKALLDSEQLAYKLTANSLYGQLGSGTFKVRLRPLAASVTAYGRKQIMFSKTAIETFYGPTSGNPRSSAVTVYGDTDSLFIAFHPKDPATGKPLEGKEALEATIALTEEAGKFVSKMLKSPHDFEFDKVYWPFIIFSKKRYVGHKYEDPDHPDKYKLAFMGVALKRRDYAPIVKRIYSSALNVMLHERNVAKAAGLVQQMTKELVEGRFGLQPLIISKSLKSEYANPKSIAHKVLADRITARDPGNAPASGDRIPFVYIQPQVGQAAPDLQGDRIETPTYIKENGLKPDYMFYIDHQIANPVCQLFGIVVDQIPGFASYKPRGGWKTENPDMLITQRETAAYYLLFGEAIERNNNGAKRAFVKMFGTEVEVQSSNTTKKVRTTTTNTTTTTTMKDSIKKQGTLDSMFADAMKLQAVKVIKQQKKAASSKEG
jgi:DNA polymerase elongation subunit (family B)